MVKNDIFLYCFDLEISTKGKYKHWVSYFLISLLKLINHLYFSRIIIMMVL